MFDYHYMQNLCRIVSFDTCSTREHATQDMMLEPAGYVALLSR